MRSGAGTRVETASRSAASRRRRPGRGARSVAGCGDALGSNLRRRTASGTVARPLARDSRSAFHDGGSAASPVWLARARRTARSSVDRAASRGARETTRRIQRSFSRRWRARTAWSGGRPMRPSRSASSAAAPAASTPNRWIEMRRPPGIVSRDTSPPSTRSPRFSSASARNSLSTSVSLAQVERSTSCAAARRRARLARSVASPLARERLDAARRPRRCR